jgi:hypothetical protein
VTGWTAAFGLLSGTDLMEGGAVVYEHFESDPDVATDSGAKPAFSQQHWGE